MPISPRPQYVRANESGCALIGSILRNPQEHPRPSGVTLTTPAMRSEQAPTGSFPPNAPFALAHASVNLGVTDSLRRWRKAAPAILAPNCALETAPSGHGCPDTSSRNYPRDHWDHPQHTSHAVRASPQRRFRLTRPCVSTRQRPPGRHGFLASMEKSRAGDSGTQLFARDSTSGSWMSRN